MPIVDVYNMEGNKVDEIELSENIFGIKTNTDALHRSVLNYLANQRQGTQSTKTRGEVSGGGIKPWRQKGTGRARQGSTRATQWIKGGIALGPKPRSYKYSLPKKVKRLALKSALSTKLADKDIIVLDKLELAEVKTKAIVNVLNNLNVNTKALIVLPEKNEAIQKSARNIPGIKTALVNSINVYDILNHDKFIITKEAVSKVEEVFV